MPPPTKSRTVAAVIRSSAGSTTITTARPACPSPATRQAAIRALVGYALDGFGIYGQHGEGGRTLTNGDLDACHGHTHTVIWDGEAREIYHYHLTDEYPYTLGCFRGTPSGSSRGMARMAQRRGPGQASLRRQGGMEQAGRPPRQGLFGLFRRPPPQRRP